MLKATRRITTGVDQNKNSVLVADEQVETLTPYEIFPSFQLQDLFYTEAHPQSLKTRHLNKPYTIELPEGAMRFLKIRMPTKKEMIKELQAAGQALPEDWTKFNLHSTDSVDYIYILSGKITCVVDDKQIDLSAGDFLAQVGPEHTWINDHDEPCYVLCVLVGIAPAGQAKKMAIENN